MNIKDLGLCYPYAVYVAAGQEPDAIPGDMLDVAMVLLQPRKEGEI